MGLVVHFAHISFATDPEGRKIVQAHLVLPDMIGRESFPAGDSGRLMWLMDVIGLYVAHELGPLEARRRPRKGTPAAAAPAA